MYNKVNAEKAKAHFENMKINYKKEIGECIDKTKVYDTYFNLNSLKDESSGNSYIEVNENDSVSQIFSCSKIEGKTAVLNFADNKLPGGLFLSGSHAQEESLCHESILYNVLSQKRDYYNWNALHPNKGLYENRCLYSPNVIFIRKDQKTTCDVITCASPNISGRFNKETITPEENTKALRSRIKFILDIAEDNDIDNLILGSFGCGVFKQNPIEVASIFKEFLKFYKFKNVYFPIIGRSVNNLKSFKDVFSCCN